MKNFLLFFVLLLSLGLFGCDKDTEIHPSEETRTTPDGTVYTVYHLDIDEDLEEYLDNYETVELRLIHTEDQSIIDILLARDEEKVNCILVFVPENSKFEDGLYKTYMAKQFGRVFTLALEFEYSNNQPRSCRMVLSEQAYAYEKLMDYDGDDATAGMESNPFLISEFEDLKNLRSCVENDNARGEGRYFKLTTNIKVDDEDLPPAEMGWRPIGFVKDASAGFAGHFDGNDKTIEGLYIDLMDADMLGLFSSLQKEATVKNLLIKDFQINTERSNIGALCGKAVGGSVIDNVNTENCIIKGVSNVGGIVGEFSGLSITNCAISAGHIIASGENVGLLAGLVRSPVTITKCSNADKSTVYGQNNVGGLIGKTTSIVELENCHNTASHVTALGDNAGGVIGYAGTGLKMNNCTNDLGSESNSQKSSLQGKNKVGGLVGSMEVSSETLFTGCSSSANIHADYDYIGGLIGCANGPGPLKLINSFCGAEGAITFGNAYGGGLIGYTEAETIIETNNNKNEISNTIISGGVLISQEGGLSSDSENGLDVGNGDYTGGIIGCSENNSVELRNIERSASVQSPDATNVGGLIGSGKIVVLENVGAGVITVKGQSNVGGLVGSINGGLLVINSDINTSLFNGHVNQEGNSSATYCGGILGYAKRSTIELTKVFATGHVSGSTDIGGLIGKIEDGQRTRLIDCKTESENGVIGASYVGGIIATLYSKDIHIRSCSNYSTIKSSDNIAGGIVGCLESKGSTETLVTECTNYASITGKNIVGGIIGQIDNPQTSSNFAVNYCTNEGVITGATDVAGCIGLIKESTFACLDQLTNLGGINVNNDPDKESDSNNVGGILARNYSDLTIQYCKNRGNISTQGSYYIGGIVGRMGAGGENYRNLKVIYCFNTGLITTSGNDGLLAGGIAGKVENVNPDNGIKDCYNTAEVIAPKHDAGIVGYTDWGVDVDRCYYFGPKIDNGIVARGDSRAQTYRDNRVIEGTPTGFTNKDKAINLSTSGFGDQSNFGDWDFDNVWQWGGTPEHTRPTLRHNVEI